MTCTDTSYDNRESCVETTPSGCVPYTGYISDTIKDDIPCRPNINDITKKLQEMIDKINTNLGDNKTLDKKCLTFDALTVKQVELNQLFITQLCDIKAQIALIDTSVDPETILVAINLLCLQDPSCAPQASYTLKEILVKLIAAYCDLTTRVQNIETLLNI